MGRVYWSLLLFPVNLQGQARSSIDEYVHSHRPNSCLLLYLKERGTMKEEINNWGLTYNIDSSTARKAPKKQERETFTVKLCPTCNCVYENKHNQYKKTIITHRYKDFPTIGLKREECQKCR